MQLLVDNEEIGYHMATGHASHAARVINKFSTELRSLNNISYKKRIKEINDLMNEDAKMVLHALINYSDKIE